MPNLISNAVWGLPMSRRQMLRRFASGFGMLGLAGLLAEDMVSGVLAADDPAANPLLVKPPQFPAKAKRIIFLFMSGGPSHVDTFDPKPRLAKEMASRCRLKSQSSNAPRPAIFCNRRSPSSNTASAGRPSANCCRISPAAWMICASFAQWWQTISIITAPACK